MKQNLILIKLGGSIITDKTKQNHLRTKTLRQLVRQIKQYKLTQSGQQTKLLIGHGQGSFAHFPAKKYQVASGLQKNTQRSLLGMGLTLQAVGDLHQLVLAEMLHQKLPAVSFRFHQNLTTNKTRLLTFNQQNLLQQLALDLLPVTTGDVILDTAQGCCVWSTEKNLNLIAQTLNTTTNSPYQVTKVIHVTDVPGVLNQAGQTIQQITPESWTKMADCINQAEHPDVTGGMRHKVETSLELAESLQIETHILSGNHLKQLYFNLTGETWTGTVIKSS